MPLSDKYTVLKTEDWERVLDTLAPLRVEDEARSLPIEGEFFVVRQQDVFAPAGLYAYAANVRTAVEVTNVMGLSLMSDDIKERLLDFADALMETAAKWSDLHENRRIPVRIPT